MRLIVRWLVTVAALVVAIVLVPGIEVGSGGWVAVGIMAVVLGFMNAILRPILKFAGCGLIVLTLGLFTLVINAFTLWVSSWVCVNWLGVDFVVPWFWPAFWGAIIVSVVSFLLSVFVPDKDEKD